MPAHVHAGGAKRRAHTLLSTSLTHPWKPLRPMSADTPQSPRSTLYYPPRRPALIVRKGPCRSSFPHLFPRPAPRRMPDSGPLRPFESPFPLYPSPVRPPLFPPSYSSSGPLDVLTVTDPTLPPPPPPPHRTEWGGSRVEGERRRGRRDERSRNGRESESQVRR